MPGVAGVILGAGLSRRLGRPKQTLPLGDTTLLGWVVREAEASSLDRIVVVTAADVATRRAEVLSPPGDGEPSSSAASLRAGLDAVGAPDAVMVLLGDMPGVDAALVDAVRAEWEAGRPWALVTEYDDGRGHPLVFSADALPELRAARGEKIAWRLLEAEGTRVGTARVRRPLPLDVDTWEDYEAAREAFAPRGAP